MGDSTPFPSTRRIQVPWGELGLTRISPQGQVGALSHSLWPAPWVLDFNLRQPVGWKTSGKLRGERGMPFRADLDVATSPRPGSSQEFLNVL